MKPAVRQVAPFGQKLRNLVIWEQHDSESAVAQRYFDEAELFDYASHAPAEPPLLDDAQYAAMREALEREMQDFITQLRARRARQRAERA